MTDTRQEGSGGEPREIKPMLVFYATKHPFNGSALGWAISIRDRPSSGRRHSVYTQRGTIPGTLHK